MHLLSKEISDIIHVNKTKDRVFDIVESLKQSTGDDQVCGCNKVSLKHFEDNPELAAKYNEISKNCLENSYAEAESIGDTTYYSYGTPSLPNPVGTQPYTLKVIFHSLHGGSSPERSASDCQELIDAFNVKYSGRGTIPTRWAAVAGDLGVRLQFEKVNSVPYTQSEWNWEPGVADIENPEYFMNVWIAPLNPVYGGYANLSGIMHTNYVCVLNSIYSNLKNTFEHEVGHLLGLEHIWGPTQGSAFGGVGHNCDDDDGVSDTPIQKGPTNDGVYGPCPTSKDSCTNNPGKDMWENIMDYSHAYCSTGWSYETSFLTLGQGDKIRATIEAAPHVDKLLETATPITKLSWPTPAGHNLATFADPDWTGGNDDDYSGHKGTDIGFHCGWQNVGNDPTGCDWNDMVNNPKPVYAAAPGTVIFAEDLYDDQCLSCNQTGPTYGDHDPGGSLCSDMCGNVPCVNSVVIDHGITGVGYRYTGYYHLQKGNVPVSAGQDVNAGDIIGWVGSSGNSCGPHLHFEVSTGIGNNSGYIYIDSSTAVDPFYSEWGGSNTTESLWVDQCALPIYNTNTPTGNVPPKAAACPETTTTTAGPTTTTAAPTTTTAAPTTTTATPPTTTTSGPCAPGCYDWTWVDPTGGDYPVGSWDEHVAGRIDARVNIGCYDINDEICVSWEDSTGTHQHDVSIQAIILGDCPSFPETATPGASPSAPEKIILNEELSAMVHANKTKERTFDIVGQLEKSEICPNAPCGSDYHSLLNFQLNPDYAEIYNQTLENYSNNDIYDPEETEGSVPTYGYFANAGIGGVKLGVVFNNLYGGLDPASGQPWPMVSDDHFEKAVDYANKMLKGETPVPDRWKLLYGDTGFQFSIEEIRRAAMPAGMEGYPYTVGWLDPFTQEKYDNGTWQWWLGRDVNSPRPFDHLPPIDIDKYTNVWYAPTIHQDGSGPGPSWAALGGVAQMPNTNYAKTTETHIWNGASHGPEWVMSTASQTVLDDIYIKWSAYGLLHEGGHWCGLNHNWGPTFAGTFAGGGSYDCNEDDGINDTPGQLGPTDPSHAFDPSTPYSATPCNWVNYLGVGYTPDTCLNHPGKDMWENAMDYSASGGCSNGWQNINDNDKGTFLTNGQVALMKTVVPDELKQEYSYATCEEIQFSPQENNQSVVPAEHVAITICNGTCSSQTPATTTPAPTTTTAAPTTTTAAPTTTPPPGGDPTTTTATPVTTTAAPPTTLPPFGTTPPPINPGGLAHNIYECVKTKGVDIQRVYVSEGALLKTVINTTLEIFFVEDTNTDVIERWINDVNAFSQIGEPIPTLWIGPVSFTNCRITKLMFPTAPSAMESAVQRGAYSMLIEEVVNGDIFNGTATNDHGQIQQLTGEMLEGLSEEISYSVGVNNQYSVNHTVSLTPNERMGTSTLTPSLIAKAVLDSWTPVNGGSMLHNSFHDVLRAAGIQGNLSSSINKITGEASWTRNIDTLDNVFHSGQQGDTSQPSTYEFVHNLIFDKEGVVSITENGKMKLLRTIASYSGSEEDIQDLTGEIPSLITGSFARAGAVFTNYVTGGFIDESIPVVVDALNSFPIETTRTVNRISQELAWSVTYSNDPKLEDDGKLIDRSVDLSQSSTGVVTISEKNSLILPDPKRSGGFDPKEGVNWYIADVPLAPNRISGYWGFWDSHLNPLAINAFVFNEARRDINYNPDGKNFSYNVSYVSDKNLNLSGAARAVGIKKLEYKTIDRLPQKMIKEFPIPGLTMLVHNPQQSNLGSRTASFTAYLDRNVFEQLGPYPSETQTLPLAIAVRDYLAILARTELLNVFVEYPGLIWDDIFVTDCTWSINSQRTITLNATAQYVQAV